MTNVTSFPNLLKFVLESLKKKKNNKKKTTFVTTLLRKSNQLSRKTKLYFIPSSTRVAGATSQESILSAFRKGRYRFQCSKTAKLLARFLHIKFTLYINSPGLLYLFKKWLDLLLIVKEDFATDFGSGAYPLQHIKSLSRGGCLKMAFFFFSNLI